MNTAIDTNVIVALWDRDNTLNTVAQRALEVALSRGQLLIAAPVFAELLACPGRDEPFLTAFFNDTGITVEWILDEVIWRAAGLAFQTYAARRRKQHDSGPRRILADFLIGAHALQNKYHLLTLDDRIYRTAFPTLKIVPP
ncbi:MAG TPA: type II toxin-antitoxin system VapC family toxin [Terriglobia bacterium]|nr:type II toxin-antitoxin system VapC family toxin [Terriglobia bacterium]